MAHLQMIKSSDLSEASSADPTTALRIVLSALMEAREFVVDSDTPLGRIVAQQVDDALNFAST